MGITRCSKMKNDLIIRTYEEKLKIISLVLNDMVKGIERLNKSNIQINTGEVIEQLTELQDFANL